MATLSPGAPSVNLANLAARRTIAVRLFDPTEWLSSTVALCQCPGASMHSGPTGKRDCRVTIDGAPTLSCLHSSCSAAITEANRLLRSEIGKAERGAVPATQHWRPSPDDVQRQRAREARETLARRASASLPVILRDFATDPVELWESSPVRLTGDPEADWRLLLRLFNPDDRLWIGEVHEANRAGRFHLVKHWRKLDHAPATRVCPNPLREGACSRSNEHIAERRYLVVESDQLSKSEVCAVFAWLRQLAKRGAVVDTGNRSLHGWFEYPSADRLAELKIILPALRCDPALFSPSQPVRLPGALRPETGQFQTLLFIDTKNF